MSPRARAVIASGKGDYLPVGTAGATARFPARGLGISVPGMDAPFYCATTAVRLSYRRASILPMRPALKPGLETVWRNRDTVQIGIDPRRAIALTGMRGAAGLLGLLDGSRDRRQVLAAAGDLGMDAGTADRVLTLLAAAGALDDCPVGDHGPLPAGMRARLAPELATTSLAHRDADGG